MGDFFEREWRRKGGGGGGEAKGEGGLRGEGVVFPDLRKLIRLLTDEIIPTELHRIAFNLIALRLIPIKCFDFYPQLRLQTAPTDVFKPS